MNDALKILIADDELSIRLILAEHLKNEGFDCETASNGEEAIQKLKATVFAAALVDVRMGDVSGLDVLKSQSEFSSPTSLIIMTAQDTLENAVHAMRDGAYDYITKPVNLDEVTRLVTKAANHFVLLLDQIERSKNRRPAPLQDLVGQSRAMLEIFKTVGRVADQDVTILVQGESGTGKEMVARAIHQAGSRSAKNFIAINCAAIPEHLFESELFGFKKGAFTGADYDKLGLLEKANGGTLFLDEIGEMPITAQVKLLRFLQDKKIQRIGDADLRALDVRIIAATNRDLANEVRQNRFREDLYFRLNTVPIQIPPLRERQDDIRALAEHFVQKYRSSLNLLDKTLSEDALTELQNREWPGNARELENAIKRVLVLSPSPVMTANEIKKFLPDATERPLTKTADHTWQDLLTQSAELYEKQRDLASSQNVFEEFLNAAEKPLIEAIYKKVGGNQLKAAEILGINRNTLRKRLLDLGILKSSTL